MKSKNRIGNFFGNCTRLRLNDLRRSTALEQLAAIKGHGLLTNDEFARFSQETQNLVAVFLGHLPE